MFKKGWIQISCDVFFSIFQYGSVCIKQYNEILKIVGVSIFLLGEVGTVLSYYID